MLSTGVFRKPLRTTIVAAMDVKTNRRIYQIATKGATVFNRLFRANIRWQALAEPFLNFCDGVHTPLFEEFATGVEAISASAGRSQADVLRSRVSPGISPRLANPGTNACFIAICTTCGSCRRPSRDKPGKSFGALADAAGAEPLEYFMDLLAEHDSAIRWKTVVTNDRARERQYILAHPTTLPGFNDSGAHARNMAFQDGGLQMLQQVLLNPEPDAARKGDP